MKKILHIILISLFSLTIFSCAKISSTDDTTPLWAQESYVKASNNDAEDFFGFYRSVALEGDTLAVGAYREDSNQTTITNDNSTASADNSNSKSGAVYVYSFK